MGFTDGNLLYVAMTLKKKFLKKDSRGNCYILAEKNSHTHLQPI